MLKMLKQLEIGKNYIEFFYIGREELIGNKKMVYNGGCSWTVINGEQTLTKDGQVQTDSLLEYTNNLPKGFVKNGVLINA